MVIAVEFVELSLGGEEEQARIEYEKALPAFINAGKEGLLAKKDALHGTIVQLFDGDFIAYSTKIEAELYCDPPHAKVSARRDRTDDRAATSCPPAS